MWSANFTRKYEINPAPDQNSEENKKTALCDMQLHSVSIWDLSYNNIGLPAWHSHRSWARSLENLNMA